MVRPAAYRKAKYEAKIDGDVVRSRILAYKPHMTEQMESKAAQLQAVEQQVKAIVENQATAVPTILVPQYLNVGRELWRLSQKFGGTTFEAEATHILDKWKARGLTQAVLTEIAALFGVTYPSGP